MANFITRVELHQASAADYAKLHEEMLKRSFATTIQSSDGRAYQLPTAMYVSFPAGVSVDQVRQLALTAAQQTGRDAIVFTAEWTSASWNLGYAL